MAMSNDECFKAALNMIQVTPEDFNRLNAYMITKLCKVIAEAEASSKEPSVYDDHSKEEIKDRILGI